MGGGFEGAEGLLLEEKMMMKMKERKKRAQ